MWYARPVKVQVKVKMKEESNWIAMDYSVQANPPAPLIGIH